MVLMTRFWRPESLAVYVLAFAWFQLLQLVPLLGLHLQLARDAAAKPAHMRASFAAASLLGLVAALPTGGLLVAAGAAIYPPELLPGLSLIALALIPTAPAAVAEMALMGQERMHLIAKVNIGESVARCLFLSILIILGAGVTLVLTGFVALRWAALGAYLRDASVRHLLDPRSVTRVALRAHLQRAPTLLSILLLSAAFSRLDVALLPLMTGLGDVAVYSIAARLYDLVLMAPAFVIIALMPALSRLQAEGEGRMQELARLVLRYGLILGVPAAIAGAYVAEPTLGVVFGERYTAAAEPFRLLLAATLIMALNQLSSCVLLVLDLQQLELPSLAAGCATLVVGLALLVPLTGIAGAAAAVLVGALVQVVVRSAFLRRSGIVVSAADVSAPLAGGATMLAILLLGASKPTFAVPAALLTYAIMLFWLHGIRPGDAAALRGFFATGSGPCVPESVHS